MLLCPFCGDENIDGADVCAECQQPLEFLSKPRAASAIEQSLLKECVSRLRPNKPLTIEASESVADALRKLVDRSVGCLVVVRDGAPVGIFSERDALLRLNVDAVEMAKLPVSEVMTASPESVDSDARLAFALHKMDLGGYRHLPVMTDGQLTGVISIRDVLRFITDQLVTV